MSVLTLDSQTSHQENQRSCHDGPEPSLMVQNFGLGSKTLSQEKLCVLTDNGDLTGRPRV